MHMNESKLTEFVSAILEFQNPSVEFETEKKFRFWFDGAQNWALFCAQLLVAPSTAQGMLTVQY